MAIKKSDAKKYGYVTAIVVIGVVLIAIVMNSNSSMIGKAVGYTSVVYKCVDSDNTLYPIVRNISQDPSYFTKGFVNYSYTYRSHTYSKTYYDITQGKNVYEWYCLLNNRPKRTWKICPEGIISGACISSQTQCVKDGETVSYANYQTKKCCAGLRAIDTTQTKDSNRQCVGAISPVYLCTSKCGDGVCGSGENSCNCKSDCEVGVTCIDSDGGLDYNVKGTATKEGWDDITDFCVDTTKLSESLCNNDGNPAYAQYSCPNGCSDGACTKRPLYALNCLYDCKDTYSCIGTDTNNIKINYSIKDPGLVDIMNRIVVADIDMATLSFARINFTSKLANYGWPIKFAYDTNPSYVMIGNVLLAHQVIGSNSKGLINVVEGSNAQEGDWIVVDAGDKGRILEVDTITIATSTQGTVKFVDAITGEAVTVTVTNNSKGTSYDALNNHLFDGQSYDIKVNQAGTFVNLTWTTSGKEIAPKIKLRDGGWVALGTVEQLGSAYNLDITNLGVDVQKTWPAVLFIEDNLKTGSYYGTEDVILVPLKNSGYRLNIAKPYTTATTIGWKKDDCTY